MRIYRVEMNGIGPYQEEWEDDDKRWEMMTSHCNASHPSPYRDPLLDHIDRHEVCGFSNLRALYAWFAGYLSDLADNGFIITVYESDEYRMGMFGQVVFPMYAKKMEDIPWDIPAINA